MPDSKFVAETHALFSLINSSIEKIFIHGLFSITEQETTDLATVGQKFEELGLEKSRDASSTDIHS